MPKAWVVRELGTPDKLRFENVEAGISGDELVRIRIRASAVNFFDLLQIAGTYQVKPDLPFIPGAEVAGEVEAAPPDSGFKPGDRVLATVTQEGLHNGGYTEGTQAHPNAVVKIPDVMSFVEGAAFFINYQTGWFGLHRRAKLQPGEVVLVHGGAGGVGTAAIQLAWRSGPTSAIKSAAASTARAIVVRRAVSWNPNRSAVGWLTLTVMVCLTPGVYGTA